MKVVNLLKDSKKKTVSSSDESINFLRNFRAMSALEGLNTTKAHKNMLNDLATGKISKQEYISARMKSAI